MVNQGMQVAGGMDIADQLARYIASLGQYRMSAYDTSGYIDPKAFGQGADMSSMLPTLAREQFERQKQTADQQYALDRERLGLSVAQFNYQQRLTEAQTKLDTVTKMAQLSGPKDQIAYQYALKGLAAPTPNQQVNLGGLLDGVNQPYTQGATPAAGAAAGAGGGAMGIPLPPVKPPPLPVVKNPNALTSAAWHPGTGPGGLLGDYSTMEARNPEGSYSDDWTGAEVGSVGQVTDTAGQTFDTSAQTQTAAAGEQTALWDPEGTGGIHYFADGGLLDGVMVDTAIVGDSETGGATGYEERVDLLPPKNGKSRAQVTPLELGPIQPGIHAVVPAVRMALGGIFGNTDINSNGTGGPGTPTSGAIYGADAIGGQPVVDTLKTGQGSQFQGLYGGISNPEYGLFDLPMAPGGQGLGKLLPSQLDTAHSLYEQGGGVDFRDVVASAMAASPKGRGSQRAARYGD